MVLPRRGLFVPYGTSLTCINPSCLVSWKLSSVGDKLIKFVIAWELITDAGLKR